MAKKILYGIMIVIAVSSLVTISACRYYSSAGRMEAMMEKLTIDMNLTDAQKAQVDELRAEMKVKSQELWTPYKNIMAEFRLQLESDTFDKTRLEELFAKTSEPREQLFASLLIGVEKFHATLTPEQKKTLLAKIDKMKNMGSRFGRYH